MLPGHPRPVTRAQDRNNTPHAFQLLALLPRATWAEVVVKTQTRRKRTQGNRWNKCSSQLEKTLQQEQLAAWPNYLNQWEKCHNSFEVGRMPFSPSKKRTFTGKKIPAFSGRGKGGHSMRLGYTRATHSGWDRRDEFHCGITLCRTLRPKAALAKATWSIL